MLSVRLCSYFELLVLITLPLFPPCLYGGDAERCFKIHTVDEAGNSYKKRLGEIPNEKRYEKNEQLSVADGFEKTDEERIDNAINEAEKLKRAGRYLDAENILLGIIDLSGSKLTQFQKSKIYGELGDVYISIGLYNKSEVLFNDSIELAQELGEFELQAVLLNNLGNLYARIDKVDEGIRAYSESLNFSKLSNEMDLHAITLANLARHYQRNNYETKSNNCIDYGLDLLDQLEGNTQKADLMINLSITVSLSSNDSLSEISYHLLKSVDELGMMLDDHRLISYANGYLAKLYENEARYEEAHALTAKALFYAQSLRNVDNKPLLALWYWQLGRIHNKLNDVDEAIDSYSVAIDNIRDFRYQMYTAYTADHYSYESMVEPVYKQFIEILLKKADLNKEEHIESDILFKIKNVFNELRVAELKDYFNDDCVDLTKNSVNDISNISQDAAIIYPILLKNKLVTLVQYSNLEIKRYDTKIDQTDFVRQVEEFRTKILDPVTNEFKTAAIKLHDAIITPILDDLVEKNISTLVFVADKNVRAVPLSALYNRVNSRYLVEDYAIANVQSLELVNPTPIAKDKMNMLLGGLNDSVQGYPSIDSAGEELRYIQSLFDGELLLNQSFNTADVKHALGNTNINVVHIASHAQFGNSADESYILTYDGRININELSEYVGLFKFRENALDLLVLSACDTAEGDYRSVLGLAGVSIKSGAKSALGTLWAVDDYASMELMMNFYDILKIKNLSRAESLQYAQKQIIKSPSYNHPAYWSSFILLNNWL